MGMLRVWPSLTVTIGLISQSLIVYAQYVNLVLFIIIMQTYIVHWENTLFYLLHFTMGCGSRKCFFEIKGF